jgi:hypothetical protein
MNKATFHNLSAKEQALVLETERKHLLTLDEDELGALHDRVRRARNKAVNVYRRQASAQVENKKARGKVSLGGRRSAAKVEVLEEALARVSARLATVARQSAAALKAERIAAARGDRQSPERSRQAGPANTATSPSRKARQRPPIETKAAASTRATGSRRQAARDAR